MFAYAARCVSFPVRSIPFRRQTAAAPVTTGEDRTVKKDKNLQYCIDQLRLMQNRDGIEPEQKSALEKAQEGLKHLRRTPNPNRREVYAIVRQVAEAMCKNFLN
jgi:hypothetical protein